MTALCATLAAAHAQVAGESRAAILLTLPASARGLALGEAWGALTDDESALFYNPAQLARVRSLAAGGSVQHYVANTTLGAFALATRAAHGTLGFGVQVLDYGTEDEIVSSGGQQGTPTGGSVSAQDIAVTAGYAVTLGSRGEWRVGTAAKLARQHVANVAGNAVAADVGAAYTAPNGWELSAALQHLGSRLTLAGVTASLPHTWRVAAASPVIRGLFGDQFALRAMGEARQSSGGAATGVLASEGTWRAAPDGLSLSGRAGYAFRGTGDDRRPLTVGGGIRLARVTVDYAYEGFDLLGATHRVGIRFGAPTGAR
ncbi:MAG TPA: PorV/PorQ family protein [Gemmatimonadaceae bacterium]|nr:PorV/PorQ family protein [Gemmatimonadaceae bacterium]